MIFRKRNIAKRVPRRQEFLTGVKDCWELARQTFPEFTLELKDVPVVFVAKSTTAGSARWKKINGVRVFNLEFNAEALTVDWEDMYLDTIPHEIAHIVTRFLHGSKVSSHGPEWKRIARALGCNGKRCHSMELNTERKRRRRKQKQLYISDNGTECLVGPVQHRRLQNDEYSYFTIRATGEELFPHNHVGPA